MEEPPRPAIPSHVRELSVDNPLYDDPSSPMAVPKLLSANAIAPGAPNMPPPPTHDQLQEGWTSVPRSVFRRVLMLLSWQEVRFARMVCTAWRKAHGTAVAGLTPTRLQADTIGHLFPSLVALDLSRVTGQGDADLKQQLVELSVATSSRLNSLKMPYDLEVDDLMLAVVGSFAGLANLSLEGTQCVTDCGSLMSLSPLQHLQALDLTSTKHLGDSAVESLSSLTSITHLSLNDCFEVTSSGLATLGNVTALTKLTLEGCPSADDAVLGSLTLLTNLHTLSLAYCGQITDRGLASIAGAPSSSTLFAAGDTMAGVGAIIGEFASRIGRSHLEQQHPAPLRCLTNLSLSGCPEVTDTGLLSLKNLTQLRSLDLLGCWMITGAGLASLTTLVQLQSLSVEVKEGLDNSAMAAVATLTTIRHLRMERCKFEVTDEVRRSNPLPAALRPLKERRTSGLQGIGRLEQLRSLQKIELAYCSGLTDVFVATICHISSIVTLNLLKSDLITQAGLAVITTLRMLRSLDLTACNDVSDIIFLCLCRLTRLEKLSLAYCSGWSEAGLESLAEIPSITDLDLAYSYPLQNRSLVALTQGLTALTSLDISGGNLLTDEGFQSLGRSHNLKRLGLEGCTGLTGGGLYAVAGLPSLSYLNLQECQGLSPEELRLLTSLHGLRELHLLDCPGVTNELLDSLEAHLPFLSTLTAS